MASPTNTGAGFPESNLQATRTYNLLNSGSLTSPQPR
jgi:hypothetical protein